MSVPSGFCPKTGIPTGMQIVGHTYDDMTVYRVASALEAVDSHWRRGLRPGL
jgi:Asp-tRNA(Asn)/Glu-tRNA(Gln) amidotransferase A subunit family amidase